MTTPNSSFDEAILRAFDLALLDTIDEENADIQLDFAIELINNFSYFAGWDGTVFSIQRDIEDKTLFNVIYGWEGFPITSNHLVRFTRD